MKKTFLLLMMLFFCSVSQADTLIFKDGRAIKGRITQVRNSYVRIQADYNQPFREFLVENIVRVVPSTSDEASQYALESLNQRATDEANKVRLQEAVQKRADELIEEAIQNSEVLSLDGASEKVRAIVKEKVSALIGEAVKGNEIRSLEDVPEYVQAVAKEQASALIGEAVRSTEATSLERTSQQVRDIAQQKAGGLIEQAVKTVEVSPFQNAPKGAQIAAKEAASILIKQAFLDAEGNKSRLWSELEAPNITLRETYVPQERSMISLLKFIVKDPITGGLILLLLVLILISKIRSRIAAQAIQEEERFEPSSTEVIPSSPPTEHPANVVEDLPINISSGKEKEASKPEKEKASGEKRGQLRVVWDIPIALHMDKVKPISAVVKNLSLSGAYAVCNDLMLFKIGDHCRFTLKLSDKDPNLAINSMVEVVRVKPSRGLGLKFLELDNNSISYLKQVVG